MTQSSRTNPMRLTRYALMVLGLALAGCDRDQVKVQEVPKDADHAAMQAPGQAANSGMPVNPHAGMDMSGMGGMAPAHVKWTLPSGWKEKAPGDMRVGSFD